MNIAKALAILLFAAAASEAGAEEKYTFAIGEDYDRSPQPWYGCDGNSHSIAQNICSVYMPDTTMRKFGYTVDVAASKDGGRCGYTTYNVGCYSMPTIAGDRTKAFTTGENFPGGCAANPVETARSFCTINGPGAQTFPFTLTRTSTRSGGQCGYNNYEVKCRAPFPPDFVPSIR